MKLTIVGRASDQCDIVLNSNYVSGYHAEIYQLDNGDMFIIDKSSNGTFIGGSRIAKDRVVPIRYGDKIMFADEPLDWSRIITPEHVAPNIKKIMMIGSYEKNNIRLSGPGVDPFHAAIMQTNDDNWYLVNYGKAGSTVNGMQIPSNHNQRIKKGDSLAVAGFPVQNPVRSSSKNGLMLGLLGGITALIVAILLILLPFSKSGAQISVENENSIALVVCEYHYELTCDMIKIGDLVSKVGSDGKNVMECILRQDSETGQPYLDNFDGINSKIVTGTAFVIGDEGYMVTNRHVVRPWEAAKIHFEGKTYNEIELVGNLLRKEIAMVNAQGKYQGGAIPLYSGISVKGVVDKVCIVSNRDYFKYSDAYDCNVVKVAERESDDIALLKMKTKVLPEGMVGIPYNRIVPFDDHAVGDHIVTIGFPFGLGLQDFENSKLEALYSDGSISNCKAKSGVFSVTAISYNGGSGSPIFNEYGKVIGILNGGVPAAEGFTYAVKSNALLKMLKEDGYIK